MRTKHHTMLWASRVRTRVEGDGLGVPPDRWIGIGQIHPGGYSGNCCPISYGKYCRPRLDSCRCEMRTLSILPRSLSHRPVCATYHLSNHFRIKTPSLLFSKICFSLACSRGSRRHLWSLSVCDQILSFGEQTSRTWFFIVMTDFWHK